MSIRSYVRSVVLKRWYSFYAIHVIGLQHTLLSLSCPQKIDTLSDNRWVDSPRRCIHLIYSQKLFQLFYSVYFMKLMSSISSFIILPLGTGFDTALKKPPVLSSKFRKFIWSIPLSCSRINSKCSESISRIRNILPIQSFIDLKY